MGTRDMYEAVVHYVSVLKGKLVVFVTWVVVWVAVMNLIVRYLWRYYFVCQSEIE